ncbi:MAG TPA: dioxygenase [Magnetospirillaceae bacterium]|jgi:catechol 1,2-dioxygenase
MVSSKKARKPAAKKSAKRPAKMTAKAAAKKVVKKAVAKSAKKPVKVAARSNVAIEDRITKEALKRVSATSDRRLRTLLQSLIKHVHAFARETALTPEEWFAGIQFLTATGQKCDQERQEFILLSDTLGLSMMLDAINHRDEAHNVTESSVIGPFYRAGSPIYPNGSAIYSNTEGEPVTVSGTVSSPSGKPVQGAVVDVWQTAPNGLYYSQDANQKEYNLCGRFHTEADGSYKFITLMPHSYPIPVDGPVGDMLRASKRDHYRPAHLHFRVSAPGHREVITEFYTKGDKFLNHDPVLGVKKSLIIEYKKGAKGYTLDRDFVLQTVK